MNETPLKLDEQVDFAVVTWPGLLCSVMAILGGAFGVPRVLALAAPSAAPPGVPAWFIYLLAAIVVVFTVFAGVVGCYLLQVRTRPGFSIGPKGLLVPSLVGDWIAWPEIHSVSKVNLKIVGYRPALILDLVPGTLERAQASDVARSNPVLMRVMRQFKVLDCIKQSPGKGSNHPHIILASNEFVLDLMMIKAPSSGSPLEQAFELIQRHIAAASGGSASEPMMANGT